MTVCCVLASRVAPRLKKFLLESSIAVFGTRDQVLHELTLRGSRELEDMLPRAGG